MKLISILDHLAAVPTAPGPTSRRNLLSDLGRFATAAVPAALVASNAAASTKDTSYDATTQLLLLERTQVALYTQALAATGLIPTAQVPDFQRMLRHQGQHAAFLVQALQNAGALVPPLPVFDFSGRHGVVTNPVLFPNVLTSYDEFLALAQQLEDLGVRLYTTHAFAVASDSLLTKAALRLRAVEAEHSAHMRGLRRGRGITVKNWPSFSDTAIVRPAGAQVLATAATDGEDNTAQYATSATTSIPFLAFLFTPTADVHPTALAEAFDEPVSSATAQAALNLFS